MVVVLAAAFSWVLLAYIVAFVVARELDMGPAIFMTAMATLTTLLITYLAILVQ